MTCSQKTHPKSKASFVSFLINRSLKKILMWYVVVLVVFGFAFASLDNIYFQFQFDFEGVSNFIRTAWINILYLFGVKIEHPSSLNEHAIFKEVFLGLRALFRTIMQTLLLGSLVFKVLAHKKIFRRRKTICVSPTSQDDLSLSDNFNEGDEEKTSGWELRIRFYNASNTNIEGLEMQSILRVPQVSHLSARIKNFRLNTAEWFISLPFVPYSFCLSLDRTDIILNENRQLKLEKIKGHSFSPVGSTTKENQYGVRLSGHPFLVVQISGSIMGLGRSFKESLWWDLSDESIFKYGKEVSIDVPAGKNPRQSDGKKDDWQGWDKFDDVEENNYIFAYGSLLDLVSLKDTLPSIGDIDLIPATLKGYKRDWNVAKKQEYLKDTDKFEYTDCDNNAHTYQGTIHVANIEKGGKTSLVTGALIKVSLAHIFDLDEREKNYVRLDVTKLISLCENKTLSTERIWAYVGTSGANDRSSQNKTDFGLVVLSAYYDSIVTGYKDLGVGYLNSFHTECGAKPQLSNNYHPLPTKQPHNHHGPYRTSSVNADPTNKGRV